jgi:hypothetical protein
VLALIPARSPAAPMAPAAAAADFHHTIEPLLVKYCYDCHGDGAHKGHVAFDEFASDRDLLARHDVWLTALRNVRSGLMPPKEDGDEALRPAPAEIAELARWIEFGAFAIDPANPDPGRVTARRLNRVEYRNTIRDLMGVDFNSEAEFPPDDSGNGFDNNGDVLTVSPLLLEKYLAAAGDIVQRAVPRAAKVVRERVAGAREFRSAEGAVTGDQLSAKQPAIVAHTFNLDRTATYQLAIDFEARGSFDFDPARCRVMCRVDGDVKFTDEVEWHERKSFRHECELTWNAGAHVVAFEVEPLPPAADPLADPVVAEAAANSSPAATESVPAGVPPRPRRQRVGPRGQSTRLDVRINNVTVRGPADPKYWTTPANYARFFPNGAAPATEAPRDAYASDVLRRFAARAFRRPVDEPTVARLTAIARARYTQPGNSFEDGVAHAMMAVLASPRFLFRLEEPAVASSGLPGAGAASIAPIDEWALASRLSYFLWSTMPDETLFALARRGELRANLQTQVTRMLRDGKAQAFVRNFTGQWLQARDVESVPINARVVLGAAARPNRDGRIEFDGPLRRLMRSETEMYFDYVLQSDRSVLELVDSDYTFLNERLAAHYGIPGVTGDEMRRVTLPADSTRGGVLTQATILAVTSNPTRTSPVKRGLFVLENFLGTVTPPPPMAVPALEDARSAFGGREPKLSEMLAVHRKEALCSSCHSRMDPIGLAFENFNALGAWRATDAGEAIDASGQLATGEKFADVRALKHVLTHERRDDFYRCLTEKLLTYALGRGLDYYDTYTVDQIVARLGHEDGRMSALLLGVIESPAFQNIRTAPPDNTVTSTN